MPAISPVSAASPVQKGSAPPVQITEPEAAAPSAQPGAATPPVVNPSLRFDIKLGLVVVEFFDESGKVANSVPSPQKLKAYEAGLAGGPGSAAAPAPEKDPSAGSGEPRRGRNGVAVVA
jgi:hypothetical protein